MIILHLSGILFIIIRTDIISMQAEGTLKKQRNLWSLRGIIDNPIKSIRVLYGGRVMRTKLFTVIALWVAVLHFSFSQPAPSWNQELLTEFFSMFERGIEFAKDAQFDSASYYLDHCQSLLDTFDTHEDHYDSVHILIADAYYELGQRLRQARDFQGAKDYHIKALDLRMQFLPDNDPAAGDSYYYLAVVHFVLGEYTIGMQRINTSLNIRKAAFGELHNKVADSYNMLGTFYSIMDEYDLAQTYYEKALAIRMELFGEEHSDIASSYNNLGIVTRQRGDTDAALEYYYKAVAIRLAEQGEEHPLTADNYMNIGVIYAIKSMFDEAIEYTKRSLHIRQAVFGEEDIRVALNLNNLGVIYRDSGDYETALEYLTKSLSIRRKLLGDVHPAIAQSLNNIGVVYKNTGDYEKALGYLREAIEQRVQIFGRNNTHVADSYVYLGNIYRKMEEYDYALSSYRKAIASLAPGFRSIEKHTNNFSVFDEAIVNRSLLIALAEKADLYYKLFSLSPQNHDPLLAAIPIYHAARYVTDLLRSTYAAEQSKLFLSEFSSEIFENAVNTLFTLYESTGDQRHITEAFSFAEYLRAMILWESIIESRARSFAGIPEDKLNEERELHQQLIQARIHYHRTQSDTDEFQSIRSNYFDILMTYRNFIADLEQTYPHYHALKYDIGSPSISDMRHVLDDNTAILQYMLGEENSFLFIVTGHDFTMLPLGPVTKIEEYTHTLRRVIRRLDRSGFVNVSSTLYSLLVEPALSYIENKNRLLIIPDGVLHHLPFETLVAEPVSEQEARPSFSSLRYLIHDFSITYNYSSKLAVFQFEQARQRLIDTRHPHFAGFAPVFASTNDEEENSYRTMHYTDGWIGELPYSEIEIQNIVDMFESVRYRAEGYYHSDATKKKFINYASEYSHIHIASHGFFNEEEPMLSGVLFSPGHDSDIDEERDILFAGEIYGLNLDCDLVVLSSCESGIGTIARGEGIVALTRGLIYAGAGNLLVSLWKVTDQLTTELMIEFYRHILDGDSYPDALRKAKLHIIQNEPSAFPMFWSGFIMIGV